jgi:three-Cys-motif partner protein
MSSPKYEWIVGQSPPMLDPHSRAKHRLLRAYLERYIEILTANPRHESLRISLIDGFCGGGEYLHQKEIVPGSPLILLQEIAAAQVKLDATRTKPTRLSAEYIFVDNTKENLTYLRHCISQSPFATLLDSSIELIHRSFEASLPDIVRKVKSRGSSERAIFFLDQYGYSDVSLQAIRTILAELKQPEIILNFSVDSLIGYLNADESFLRGVAPVELSLQQLHEMLDIKSQNQREARWLIQHFLYQHLIQRMGTEHYYTCFFLKSSESHRAYWLVHISKHPRARDEMAERHWALTNHFVHHGKAGLQMLGFDPEKDLEQLPLDFLFDDNAAARSHAALLDQLPQRIYGAGNVEVTLGSIFTEICNETPATISHVSGVLTELRNEKDIEIFTKDGSLKPRATRLDWTDVIVPHRAPLLFTRVRRSE